MSITINGQEIEVKPCPFCGSTRGDVIDGGNMVFYFECFDCGAAGPPRFEDDISPIEAWNRRDQK